MESVTVLLLLPPGVVTFPQCHAGHLRSEAGSILQWWLLPPVDLLPLRRRKPLGADRRGASSGRRRVAVVVLLVRRRGGGTVGGTLLVLLLSNWWLELGRGGLSGTARVVRVELFALAEGMVHRVVAHGRVDTGACPGVVSFLFPDMMYTIRGIP